MDSLDDDTEEVRVIYRDTRETPCAEKVSLSTGKLVLYTSSGLESL